MNIVMIRSEKVKSERGVLLFIIPNSKSKKLVPFLIQKILPNQTLGVQRSTVDSG